MPPKVKKHRQNGDIWSLYIDENFKVAMLKNEQNLWFFGKFLWVFADSLEFFEKLCSSSNLVKNFDQKVAIFGQIWAKCGYIWHNWQVAPKVAILGNFAGDLAKNDLETLRISLMVFKPQSLHFCRWKSRKELFTGYLYTKIVPQVISRIFRNSKNFSIFLCQMEAILFWNLIFLLFKQAFSHALESGDSKACYRQRDGDPACGAGVRMRSPDSRSSTLNPATKPSNLKKKKSENFSLAAKILG